jgi:8-oxo-dGTP pyrophosphatase MutT (NUDIX family)
VEKDPLEEIKKEVQEETGYEFEATGLIGIYSIVKYYPDEQIGKTRHSILLIFRGKIVGGSLMEGNDEISEAKWFESEELTRMKNNELRDPDIKERVQDYFAGRNFPLDIISHTVQN